MLIWYMAAVSSRMEKGSFRDEVSRAVCLFVGEDTKVCRCHNRGSNLVMQHTRKEKSVVSNGNKIAFWTEISVSLRVIVDEFGFSVCEGAKCISVPSEISVLSCGCLGTLWYVTAVGLDLHSCLPDGAAFLHMEVAFTLTV